MAPMTSRPLTEITERISAHLNKREPGIVASILAFLDCVPLAGLSSDRIETLKTRVILAFEDRIIDPWREGETASESQFDELLESTLLEVKLAAFTEVHKRPLTARVHQKLATYQVNMDAEDVVLRAFDGLAEKARKDPGFGGRHGEWTPFLRGILKKKTIDVIREKLGRTNPGETAKRAYESLPDADYGIRTAFRSHIDEMMIVAHVDCRRLLQAAHSALDGDERKALSLFLEEFEPEERAFDRAVYRLKRVVDHINTICTSPALTPLEKEALLSAIKEGDKRRDLLGPALLFRVAGKLHDSAGKLGSHEKNATRATARFIRYRAIERAGV